MVSCAVEGTPSRPMWASPMGCNSRLQQPATYPAMGRPECCRPTRPKEDGRMMPAGGGICVQKVQTHKGT